MALVDIIIISYKDKEEINLCINSIHKYCYDYNLIIEDNNPPNINNGFTKSVNNAIKKGNAPFIWLLNSDAEVLNSKTQKALIDRFSYSDRVGIVGSMQLDKNDPDIIRCGGVFPVPFPGGRHRGGRISMGHWRIPEKQTWQNFASVMIRRSMTEKIGLLDESMFLIFSDSSYCYTARQNGFECWYEPYSKVFHKLGASGGITEWHKKDMAAFMNKWGIQIIGQDRFSFSPEFDKLNRFP